MQSYLLSGMAGETLATGSLARRMATDSRRRDWRDGALVGLAGLLVLLIADALVQDARTPRGDDQIYELMANDPFETHSFPFAYRFLVPTIVHVMPFSNELSFSLLAWLSTAACGAIAYVLMRRFDVKPWLAAPRALPRHVPAAVRRLAAPGHNVDPETVLVMLIGGLAIADRRPLALGITVAIGATIRESALFLIPFAYAYWAARLIDTQALKRTLAAGLPAWRSTRRCGPASRPPPTATAASGASSTRSSTTQGRGAPHLQLVRPALVRGAVRAAHAALRARRPGAVRLLPARLPVRPRLGPRDPARRRSCTWPGRVLDDRRRLAIAAVLAFVALDVGYAVYMQVHGVESNIVNGPLPSYPIR